jgi:hypothetical protein
MTFTSAATRDGRACKHPSGQCEPDWQLTALVSISGEAA